MFSTRMAKEKWLRGGVVDASYMENLYTPVAKCKNPGYSRISIYINVVLIQYVFVYVGIYKKPRPFNHIFGEIIRILRT